MDSVAMSRELNRRCLDAMDLVAGDNLEAAELAYAEILRDAELQENNDLPEICGQIATLKQRLGNLDQALSFHQRALAEALAREEPTDLRVDIYRYFLGEFLVSLGRAIDALPVIEDGLNHGDRADRILRIAHARCLWEVGRRDDAKQSAIIAMQLATNDGQRKGALEQLKHVLQT